MTGVGTGEEFVQHVFLRATASQAAGRDGGAPGSVVERLAAKEPARRSAHEREVNCAARSTDFFSPQRGAEGVRAYRDTTVLTVLRGVAQPVEEEQEYRDAEHGAD